MSLTSKSPRRVAITALVFGQRSLPTYAHKFAPKTFTQPQLLACLVLKRFFRTDDRGVEAILRDSPTLCGELGLARVPDHTTLHRAERRLIRSAAVRRLLFASVKAVLGRGRTIRRAAADSTGFESSEVSPYFVKRRTRCGGRSGGGLKNPLYQTTTYTRFPKLQLLVDCDRHLILAAYPKRGPSPDVNELDALQAQRPARLRIKTLLADAGYDSERNHRLLRELLGIKSYINPTRGRPSAKPAAGRWRRHMQRVFRDPAAVHYGQRWQVETVNSMIKRRQGHAVTARRYHAQNRQMLLACVAHNVMVVRETRGSQQSRTGPFLGDLFLRTAGHFCECRPNMLPSVSNARAMKP